jgi:hypothetical protein
MAVYCYRCAHCGRVENLSADIGSVPPPPVCNCDLKRGGMLMRRDYKADGVGLTGMVELKRVREFGGSSAVRDLFLPTAAEMAGPNDPDGSKGIEEWNERNQPKNGNKHPTRPVAPKKVF